jgi:hypothetical protein
MHTALVSRLLKDRSLWEEAHISREESSAEIRPVRENTSVMLQP